MNQTGNENQSRRSNSAAPISREEGPPFQQRKHQHPPSKQPYSEHSVWRHGEARGGRLSPAISTVLNPQEQKLLFSIANKEVVGLFWEIKWLNMPLSALVETDLSGLENIL